MSSDKPPVPKRPDVVRVEIKGSGVALPPKPATREKTGTREKAGGTKERKEREKKSGRRRAVCAEILSTEESYVSSLEVLEKIYIKPMLGTSDEKTKPLLTQQQGDILFGNVQTLLTLNKKFRDDLKKRLSEDFQYQRVGDLFLSFTPFFKMYSTYTTNHEMSIDLLNQLEEKEEFAAFLAKKLAEQGTGGQTLPALLIMPIQRIPRYRLLLEELLKNTEQEHVDTAKLTEALELVKKVANHVNEEVRLQDNRNKMRQLERQFSENPGFVDVGRRLIKQGPLLKKSRRGRDLPYEFFLFNDLIAYAEGKTILGKTRYKLHRKIHIDRFFKVTPIDIALYKDSFKKEECTERDEINGVYPSWVTRAFTLGTSDKSFACVANSTTEKDEWFKAFQQAGEEFEKRIEKNVKGEHKSTAPIWVPDTVAETCPLCREKFSLLKRKHHCRACGALVCDSCSKSRRVLKWSHDSESTEERVCDKCSKGAGESFLNTQKTTGKSRFFVEDIQVISKCCGWKKHCEYHIRVSTKGPLTERGDSQLIFRTYADFQNLDRRLKTRLPSLSTTLPRLPPPDGASGPKLKLSLMAVEARKTSFNEFLQKSWDTLHEWGHQQTLYEELETFFGFKIS